MLNDSSNLLSHTKPGILFVVSAPAGTGKTTLVQMLTDEFDCVVRNISYTTREPRNGEIPGVDYNFISRKEFEKKIANNDFLEYATVYGNYYGTTLDSVKRQLESGKHVFLVIDTQGALQLKDKVSAVFVFLEPPSLTVLRQRLIQRMTESPESVEQRLQWAVEEFKAMSQYDYRVINDDLNTAYQNLRSILIAEDHRVLRK